MSVSIATGVSSLNVLSQEGASMVVGRGLGSSQLMTAVQAGDSLTQNNVSRTLTSGVLTGSLLWDEGKFNWMNAMSGHAFDEIGNVAVGGKTIAEFRSEQLPQVLALMPNFAFWCSGGTNSIFTAGASLESMQTDMRYIIEAQLDKGIIPVVSNIPARATTVFSQSNQAQILRYNDFLLNLTASKKFILDDVNKLTVDPTSTQRVPRSGWFYDTPAIHWNNVGAYYLGKQTYNTIKNFVSDRNILVSGDSGWVAYNSTTGGNLLDNPNFSGSGGTAGTGVSGTIPTNWTVQRGAGTPTAVCSVVDITDTLTGLAIGKALQVVVTASATGDRIDILSSDLASRISSGNAFYGSARIIVGSSPTNLQNIRIRAFADSSAGESAWIGGNQNTAQALPEGFDIVRKTEEVYTVGSVSAGNAGLHFRIQFLGAGSATITIAMPRFNCRVP